MNNEMYRKLVDLYAERELPSELEEELELAAQSDPDLAQEMRTLRETVDLVRSGNEEDIVSDSYQRTLVKLYTGAAEFKPAAANGAHWQYDLPMQG